MSAWWCEASLFCEAPQWLAKQTTDVRLSLWESKLSEGAAENFVTSRNSLPLSVCLCRCYNQVLFVTNEWGTENVYIQYVSAAKCCCRGQQPVSALNRRKNTVLVHLSLNAIHQFVWACLCAWMYNKCVCMECRDDGLDRADVPLFFSPDTCKCFQVWFSCRLSVAAVKPPTGKLMQKAHNQNFK